MNSYKDSYDALDSLVNCYADYYKKEKDGELLFENRRLEEKIALSELQFSLLMLFFVVLLIGFTIMILGTTIGVF